MKYFEIHNFGSFAFNGKRKLALKVLYVEFSKSYIITSKHFKLENKHLQEKVENIPGIPEYPEDQQDQLLHVLPKTRKFYIYQSMIDNISLSTS